MEWLLVIVLVLETQQDKAFEPVRFASSAECLAAAEKFVAAHPGFELRLRSEEEFMVEHPVLRSYVECMPAAQYRDRD